MKRLPFALLGVLLLGAPVGAQTILIDHRAVACAAAERFPRIDARFAPIDGLAKARVLFQGDNRAEWYSVAMKAESDSFVGVLPKPKKSLKAFRYYVEVTSKTLETSRTPEFSTAIVSSSSECKGGLMAGSVAAASVVVQGPTGAAVLPGGFASAGIWMFD